MAQVLWLASWNYIKDGYCSLGLDPAEFDLWYSPKLIDQVVHAIGSQSDLNRKTEHPKRSNYQRE